jgi:aspartate carbamoyltransferase
MPRAAGRKQEPRKSPRAKRAVDAAPAASACPCGECGTDEALRQTHERWRRMLSLLSEDAARLFVAEKALELGESGIPVLARVIGWPAARIRQAVGEFESAPEPKAAAEPPAAEHQAADLDLTEYQDWHDYEHRLQRPMLMKLPEFERHERLRHVVFAQQFNRGILDRISQITTKIRALAETREGRAFLAELLRYKRAMLYFSQASTRTFLSFMAACQILGMSCNEIRDSRVSSEAKGESPLDSIRMFSSYFDLIIMRAKYPRFAEACAYLMNDLDRMHDADHAGHRGVPIINAGSGADEHPTQALLDIYTLQRIFSFESKKDSSRRRRFEELRRKFPDLTKGLNGKVYCFCGDIGRGRTVRSLATLLALYENVTMYFIYPPHPKLELSTDLRDFLLERRVRIYEGHRLEAVIGDIDVLYMTRIQREHDKDDQYSPEDLKACQLTRDLVDHMKEYAAILHPFPRNGRDPEIPFEVDDDPRAMYFEQSHNGMWVRAALLSYLFNVDGEIYSEHEARFARHHDYNEGVLS